MKANCHNYKNHSELKEVTTKLHNQKCWLTSDGRLAVYDFMLARKLNRHLKTYDNGKYVFQPHEEAIFKISENEINFIILKFLTKKGSINDRSDQSPNQMDQETNE